VDTAGRLHIDDDLMNELQAVKDAVQPSDLLYVADSMTGQDAIRAPANSTGASASPASC
jgi:signal recognition particle subunit SRP54